MVNCPTVSNTELTTPEPVEQGASKKKKKKKKYEPCNRHDFCCHEDKKEKVDSMLSKTSKCPATATTMSTETSARAIPTAMPKPIATASTKTPAAASKPPPTAIVPQNFLEEQAQLKLAMEQSLQDPTSEEIAQQMARNDIDHLRGIGNDLGDFVFAGSCSRCMGISFNDDSFMDEPKAQCTENELEQVFSSDPTCFWHFYLTL